MLFFLFAWAAQAAARVADSARRRHGATTKNPCPSPPLPSSSCRSSGASSRSRAPLSLLIFRICRFCMALGALCLLLLLLRPLVFFPNICRKRIKGQTKGKGEGPEKREEKDGRRRQWTRNPIHLRTSNRRFWTPESPEGLFFRRCRHAGEPTISADRPTALPRWSARPPRACSLFRYCGTLARHPRAQLESSKKVGGCVCVCVRTLDNFSVAPEGPAA